MVIHQHKMQILIIISLNLKHLVVSIRNSVTTKLLPDFELKKLFHDIILTFQSTEICVYT